MHVTGVLVPGALIWYGKILPLFGSLESCEFDTAIH